MLEQALAELSLGSMRYFARVGSTNDVAIRWAQEGVAHHSLVVADEQSSGRGRLNRRWVTSPGSALAFSLILRPDRIPLNFSSGEEYQLNQMRLTALGALAVCETLSAILPPSLPAQIKWPNDVIASRRKLSGVLVELQWMGSQLEAAILGIGVNVTPRSVPAADQLDFPATCVEEVANREVDRWSLLGAILDRLYYWEQRIHEDEFIHAWRDQLAFQGEWVQVIFASGEASAAMECQIAGLEDDGSLRVRQRSGAITTLQFGEVRLRPIDSLPNSAKLSTDRCLGC